MRPARPGDNISDHLTTRVFNELVKGTTTNANKPHVPLPHIPVSFLGISPATIQQYIPVAISGPALDNTDEGELDSNEYYRYPSCDIALTGLSDQNIAVTQTPIGDEQPGLCILSGLTWVQANITNLTHKYLKVSSNALVSDEHTGCAYIITPPGTTGVGYCLVILGLAIPTEVQTVITALQVTATHVQYKTRDLLVFPSGDESDWVNLPSAVCPEIP